MTMKWKAPTSRWGQFSLGFIVQFFSFFILVLNARAYNHDNYLWTGITDTIFSLTNFAMSKLMIDDENARTWYVALGYSVGGTLGSFAAMFVASLLHF